MRILVDRREQQPYGFERYQVETAPATLPCGDYSLPGFQDRIAIERKSLDDLVGCLLGTNRDRFERELARSRHFELFAVIVESALLDVSRGHYTSNMNSHAALQSIICFQVRYNVAFIWAGSRVAGEYITYSLLEKYLSEIGKRYEKAQTAQTTNMKEQESN